jgi:hypothetical protein
VSLTLTRAVGGVATMSTNGVGSSLATCPSGTSLISGGWDGLNAPPTVATVGYNRPLTNSWSVIMANNGGPVSTFQAVAECATLSSAATGAAAARARAEDAATFHADVARFEQQHQAAAK